MHFTLEQHKFFPIIAWTLSIVFALFVGKLALQLQDVADGLAAKNNSLESVVLENSARLDSLENSTVNNN